MKAQKDVEGGLKVMEEAVAVRTKITKLYQKYTLIANQVTIEVPEITRANFKRAVDACYYFGGGWPHANSKGRLETLLDNFAHTYKILHLAGKGHMVETHLAQLGISVKILAKDRIKDHNLKNPANKIFEGRPTTTSKLVLEAIEICEELQAEICELADTIKYDLRPSSKDKLQLEDEEYDRLLEVVRVKQGGERKQERFKSKKKVVVGSVQNFTEAVDHATKVTKDSS